MSAWSAEVARDAMTLMEIRVKWHGYYHAWFDGSAYRAERPDGVILPPASTPAGLDSAIRADFSRWGSR